MFSNHKSSFQITNQVQNQFVFKSRTPNSLVTDPSGQAALTQLTNDSPYTVHEILFPLLLHRLHCILGQSLRFVDVFHVFPLESVHEMRWCVLGYVPASPISLEGLSCIYFAEYSTHCIKILQTIYSIDH